MESEDYLDEDEIGPVTSKSKIIIHPIPQGLVVVASGRGFYFSFSNNQFHVTLHKLVPADFFLRLFGPSLCWYFFLNPGDLQVIIRQQILIMFDYLIFCMCVCDMYYESQDWSSCWLCKSKCVRVVNTLQLWYMTLP